jgi:hypothetical protein
MSSKLKAGSSKEQIESFDGLVKPHHNRWLRKKPKFKARKSRGVRRTCSTPQRQRDEAQRRNWAFYEAINVQRSAFSVER